MKFLNGNERDVARFCNVDLEWRLLGEKVYAQKRVTGMPLAPCGVVGLFCVGV